METEIFDLAQQPVCEQNRLGKTNLNLKSRSESQLRSLPRFANREVSATLTRIESVELPIFKTKNLQKDAQLFE